MTIKETIAEIKKLLPREQLRLLREPSTWLEVSQIEDKVSQVTGKTLEVPETIHELYGEIGGEKVKEPSPDKPEPETQVRFLGEYRLLAPVEVCQRYNSIVSEMKDAEAENSDEWYDTQFVPLAEHRNAGGLVCVHMETTKMMSHSEEGMELIDQTLEQFFQAELEKLQSIAS